MTRIRIASALVCLTLAWPTAAHAGLVTWELEGTIELVAPDARFGANVTFHPNDIMPLLEAAGINPGDGWRARLTFDPYTTADPCQECAAGNAWFDDATKAMDFLTGEFAAHSSPSEFNDALVTPLGL